MECVEVVGSLGLGLEHKEAHQLEVAEQGVVRIVDTEDTEGSLDCSHLAELAEVVSFSCVLAR